MTFDDAVKLANHMCATFADMIVLGIQLTEWDYSQGYIVRVYHIPSQCPYTFAGVTPVTDRVKFVSDGIRDWSNRGPVQHP